MDRRERIDSPNEMLIVAMQGWQTDIWTALPGIVQSFDAQAQTCVVQPSIRFKIHDPAIKTYNTPTMIKDPSGQFYWDQMPLLLDCPVVFPSGGGVTLTFPIAAGDEVLVIFASRCIDAWWQAGGVQNQAAVRMHDLSDGFVIPQVRSKPRQFAVSTGAAQLRTDDGSAYVELNPTSKQIKALTTGAIVAQAGGAASITAGGDVAVQAGGNLTAQATGAATVTAPTITLNGNVTINGTLSQVGGGASSFSGNVSGTGNFSTSGDVIAGGKSLKTHVHSGVTTGTGNTGAPV